VSKVILSTIALYLAGHLMATATEDCKGWACEEVSCPDGYAVKTPDGYLPCEDFDLFIETKNKELLK
jgi:hypothetical protein